MTGARPEAKARIRWEYETLLIGNDKLTVPAALARVATAGPRPWPATG